MRFRFIPQNCTSICVSTLNIQHQHQFKQTSIIFVFSLTGLRNLPNTPNHSQRTKYWKVQKPVVSLPAHWTEPSAWLTWHTQLFYLKPICFIFPAQKANTLLYWLWEWTSKFCITNGEWMNKAQFIIMQNTLVIFCSSCSLVLDRPA